MWCRRHAWWRRLAAGVAVGVLVICAGLAAWRSGIAPSAEPARASLIRDVVDLETGQVVRGFRIPRQPQPWRHPRTGRRTLVLPERCYWTREGRAKLDATLVVLNEVRGLPGPTMCPDCGRPVVPHNPLPPPELFRDALAERRARGR